MTEPMSAERLAEIRKREQAARPGPWQLRDDNAEDGFPRPLWIVEGPDEEPGDLHTVINVGDGETGEFIAHARTDVPDLLAEVERLRAELNETRRAAHPAARGAALRVYRLHVTYPPGSHEPGWEPPDWNEEETDPETGAWEPVSFQWPDASRRYLSRSSAKRRADLLTQYGAIATIERSAPITWPSEDT